MQLLRAMAIWVLVPVLAAQASTSDDLLSRGNLLDDPAGTRTQLNDAGWSPFATVATEIWGNVRGGIRNGLTDDLLLTFGGEADLEKIAGWNGAALRLSVHYLQGTQPNHNTGAFDSITDFDASDHVRVYNLYLRQNFLDDQIVLKVGQLGFDDDFCQPPCLGSFINAALTAPPVVYGQVLANGDITLPQYPLDAPGIFIRLQPRNFPGYSITGVYLSDAGPDVSNNHGFDWRAGNSVAVIHENGWHYRLKSLAGTFAIGGFYNNGQFTNWDNGAAQRGVYGAYGFVNQALSMAPAGDGGDAQPVISAFGYVGWAGPDTRVMPNFNYAAGLNWNGPLPGRPQDSAAFAVLYTGFSAHFTRSAFNPNGPGVTPAAQTAVELAYTAAIAPWFTLQPDAQLIFNPTNAGTRATAVVVGARATVSF